MVKIKCIFQLILTVDFMAFYFIKMHILLNVDKEASASVTPTRALPVDLAGGIASPKPHAMSPNHGDRSTPMLALLHSCTHRDAYI